MLLSNFRKIDPFSSLRLILLAILCIVGVYFVADETVLNLVIFAVGLVAFGALCWTLYTDRWAHKGTQFRFLVAVLLLFPFAAEFTAYKLIVGGMILETNWQFAEYFRRRRNPTWILHMGTLSALGWLLFPEGSFYIALGSLVALLFIAGLNLRSILQFLLSFLLPISLPLFFSSAEESIYFSLPQILPVPAEWWVLPAVIFGLTIHQFTISYRLANNLNKLRSLLALTWILLGSMLAMFVGGEGGYVLLILGLTYQGANALYYYRRKVLVEVGFLILLAFSLAYSFNLLEVIWL